MAHEMTRIRTTAAEAQPAHQGRLAFFEDSGCSEPTEPTDHRPDHGARGRARRRALLQTACLIPALAMLDLPSVAAAPGASTGADALHAGWDALLKRHVMWTSGGEASTVNYRGFLADRAELRRVLEGYASVSRTQYDAMRRDERLAFLVNVYNAWTIEFVLTRYPELKSIKELGSLLQSPWKRRFVRLFGEEVHLDHIEHEVVRAPGVFDEPRIHFALVCASVGCPALRPEAFVAARLDAQFEDSARRFLRDRARNRFNPRTGKLEVSKIFDWYKADFERGGRGAASREAFFARYADLLADDPKDQAAVRELRVPIAHLDYDWSLNDRR